MQKDIFDVICIGHACIDLNFSIHKQPDPDEKLITNRMKSEGGGPAANAAFAISRLNGKAVFCGYVGNDLFGEQQEEELKKEGVDTRFLCFGPEPTPVSSVYVLPAGHRSIVNYRTKDRQALPTQGFGEQIDPRCLLFDGHELAPSLEAIDTFPEIPSILDAGSVNAGTTVLYNKVTYLVASIRFALDFTGEKQPDKALEALSRECSDVAITNGYKGIYWASWEKNRGHIEARKIVAVDTTGAGDIFHGAFALAIARNQGFLKALHFGNKVAAISCAKSGARFSAPRNIPIT